MIGTRSFSPVALPGGYGAEDTWWDCRGASNWLNPQCYGPTGVAIRAAEAAQDMVTDNGGGPVQPEAPTTTTDVPAPQKTPGPPDIWEKDRLRGGGPRGGSVAAVAIGVVLLGTGVYFLTRKKGRKR